LARYLVQKKVIILISFNGIIIIILNAKSQ
jgi:hypothetical protein